MRTPRTPNQALRDLIGQARWSGAQLAREVNALAAEQQLVTRCDRSTVGHWLEGTVPRPPVPQLVAEVLSRRLGREVTAVEADLIRSGSPYSGVVAAPLPRDVVDQLERLGMVAGNRALGRTVVFSLSALELPGWEGARAPATGARDTQAQPPAPAQGVGARLQGVGCGPPDVLAAQKLLDLFSRADATFGGGRVHDVLRAYLATSVVAWLRQRTSPAARRRLLVVAGQLCYLCAFAHYDTSLHGIAQRYYLIGAALLREAGDRVGYALCARGLSVQAHSLGHHEQAAGLAGAAVRIGLPYAPAHQRAFLLGQLAVAQAHRADQSSAARHLRAAERLLERATDGDTPIGSFHEGSLALQRASVARARSDHRQEAGQLHLSLRYRPRHEKRSLAVATALLAEAQLDLGHLDLACHTWRTFVAGCPDIDSSRARRHVRTMVARLRPYAAHRAAADLCDLARDLPAPHGRAR
ncbi:hypothetical protein [Streptomyces sp. NPDC051567]|uniref:hypothetical protein n=1 Tax=Streptomyces sp. NPDC051567 TaxID=3365660 RepID=UPI00378CEA55